jgi:TolA-binding protein
MRILLVVLMLAPALAAAPPSTCGLEGDYERALCAYQTRDFAGAETGFRAIADAAADDPRTIRSMYFLARTLMKSGRFDEASTLLIRIYSLDQGFYQSWSCDFLLGECRRATGR